MPASPSRREACVLCGSKHTVEIPLALGNYQCPVCDLRFVEPARRLKKDDEDARYRTHNNDVNDPNYRAFLQPMVKALQPRLKPMDYGLDFGCGPGPLLAEMFRELGHAVEIYDPLFFPQPPPTHVQFDFITSTEVVEHLFFPMKEFKRLHAWLKPGGWLAIMTAIVDAKTDFPNWYYRRDPSHVVFYSRATFLWIAKTLGFEQVTWVGDRIVLLRKV